MSSVSPFEIRDPATKRTLDRGKNGVLNIYAVSAGWIVALLLLTGIGVIQLRALGVDPEHDFSPVLILIAYSPLIASLLTVMVSRMGFRYYWDSIMIGLRVNRSSVVWLLLVTLTPFLLVLIGAMIQTGLHANTSQTWFVWSAIPAGLGAIVAGSFGEELGWRGFMQPLLQSRLTILKASLVIGIIWATWHLWPLLCHGSQSEPAVVNITNTYVRLIATAVVYGWLFNRKSGLLLVMIAHASHNISVDMFSVADSQSGTQGTILAALYAILAIAVLIYDRVSRRQSATQLQM